MANPFYVDPTGGFNTGAGISQALGSVAGAVDRYKATQQQEQQQARLQEGAKKYQQAIASGDIGQVSNLMLEYPELQQTAERAFGFSNDQTKRIATDIYTQAYLNPEQAPQILEQGAAAIEQAGGQPIMTLEDARELQGLSPQEVKQRLGVGIASINPQLAKQLRGQEMTIQEQQRQQQINLDRERFEYGKAQDKLDREAKQLDNQLKKAKTEAQTQQVQQKIAENEKQSESLKMKKISDAQSSIAQAQDTIGLINRIMKSEGFSSAVGTKGASSLFGLLDQPIGGSAAADTVALLETLESQNFLNAIQQMRGMGALSNAEGQKVSSAVQNLSRNQTEKQLRQNLNEIIEITNRGIEKSRKIIQQEGGEVPQQRVEAPQIAIDFLKQNPNLSEQFRAKYGYLPEGI